MKTIGRPKAALVLSDDEREDLVRLTKRARVNRHLAFRAKLVLSCADGVSSADVARRCRTSNQTVCKWRQRFIARRMDGLYDEPRVGAPRKISDENVEALIVKTLETTPKGRTHWSTRKMASQVGISHTMVGRIWRTFGLRPAQDPFVQAFSGSSVGGEDQGHRRPVHEPARKCGGVRGRREVTDSGS